jgi:hypothetical protein
MIELTNRKYADPWTPEDAAIAWRNILRHGRQAVFFTMPMESDKRDAETMLNGQLFEQKAKD